MMTTLERLRTHRTEILDVARQHGASRVRVFGSVARGEAEAASDIDLLVEFEPDRSLLDHISLAQSLQDMLHREIDIVSQRGLSPHLADRILGEAVPL